VQVTKARIKDTLYIKIVKISNLVDKCLYEREGQKCRSQKQEERTHFISK
jgi:hypothetical protein